VAETAKTFQCTVIMPQGKLLDCRASSVIIPSHDGQLGILPGHMPIFCQLGLGTMEVKCPQTDDGQSPFECLLLIDGGFAMFNSNNLAVTATGGFSMREMTSEKLEQLIESCRASIASPDTNAVQRPRQERRLSILESLRQHLPAGK
jgi:F-type H+-transporting ATPase subunit epsilon